MINITTQQSLKLRQNKAKNDVNRYCTVNRAEKEWPFAGVARCISQMSRHTHLFETVHLLGSLWHFICQNHFESHKKYSCSADLVLSSNKRVFLAKTDRVRPSVL